MIQQDHFQPCWYIQNVTAIWLLCVRTQNVIHMHSLVKWGWPSPDFVTFLHEHSAQNRMMIRDSLHIFLRFDPQFVTAKGLFFVQKGLFQTLMRKDIQSWIGRASEDKKHAQGFCTWPTSFDKTSKFYLDCQPARGSHLRDPDMTCFSSNHHRGDVKLVLRRHTLQSADIFLSTSVLFISTCIGRLLRYFCFESCGTRVRRRSGLSANLPGSFSCVQCVFRWGKGLRDRVASRDITVQNAVSHFHWEISLRTVLPNSTSLTTALRSVKTEKRAKAVCQAFSPWKQRGRQSKCAWRTVRHEQCTARHAK